jgi:hypothetical protein
LTLAAAASLEQPSIVSIRTEKNDVVVTARVPAGVKKITLEGRTRVGAGAWIPRAVERLDGLGGEVSFRLPFSETAELLRIRADETEPLPATFYKGTNSFAGPANSGGAEALGPMPPMATGVADRNAAGGDAGTRAVVESDIWKIEGTTLYFFNQYRGLQVIDMTTPDSPVIRGTLPLPAAGEQMYVLESGPVVLLAHDGCGWGSSGDQSRVLIVSAPGGVPGVIASLPINGSIQESRMVGTALYVVSQTYRPVPNSRDNSWEWGSLVSSFDLSNPASPSTRDTLWQAGYGNVITANDQFLFVVTQDPVNWWRSVVRCIDISSPDGAMKMLSSIKTSGRVPDKFKINQDGDTLTIISENWNTNGRGVFTLLETFSMANPTVPAKLGQLELARGEQLHATRFDGNRVYVVTFFRVDPLWVIDLSNPTDPHVVGELHVPGWSTFIQPLGDKLVSIGIDNTNSWRVAVSLFDVKDPAKPALLDKVPLGDNYSWSEATYDEKAFSVLPDSGLILVPFQGQFENGYASRVQLIDLNATSLKARGTIEHQFQPRRATVYGNRVLSIAGNELLVVDAADRDHPVVKSTTELAWPVGKVFAHGSYLLEISAASSWLWNNQSPGNIRIVAAADPSQQINLVSLKSDLPVVGSTLKGDRLFVLQGKPMEVIWPPVDPNNKEVPQTPTTNSGKLFLTVFDASQLPSLKVLGQTEALSDDYSGGTLAPLWVRSDMLVWTGGGSYFYPFLRGGIASDVMVGRPWWGGGGGLFFAFDVADPGNPEFLSEVSLGANGRWWSFGSVFASNGFIYTSHQGSEFLEGVQMPNQPKPDPIITIDPVTGEKVVTQPPVGIWVTRYYLDVIDYADPKAPTIRKPVNVPGTLRGISHSGAILYTVAAHWDQKWATDWSEWLDASAYDSISASLVDSLPLKDWPHPVLVNDGNAFVGHTPGDGGQAHLEVWRLADSGKFAAINSIPLDSSANDMLAYGNLVALQQNSQVTLVDISNPASMSVIGAGQPAGCLWYDLKNADGTLDKGLWLPLNEYGVANIPVKAKPAP